MKRLICSTICVFLFLGHGLADAGEDDWTVHNVVLSPNSESSRKISALAAKPGRKAEALTFDVVLTELSQHFVTGDKLVLLGEAGRAQAVVIYDLSQRRELDWFYCYYPQRVSPSLIAYVEFYPAHASNPPKDVVLIYDLARDALANRLGQASKNNRVQVGIPVFPLSNAEQRSYLNATNAEGQSPMILPRSFLMMSRGRLVFVGVQGLDATDYQSFVVLLDLSKGIAQARPQRLDFPVIKTIQPVANPNYVLVERLEVAGDDEIRVVLRDGVYEKSSILIPVPGIH